MRLLSPTLLGLILWTSPGVSQTPGETSQFKLAQGLEQAGDLEKAVQHYRELADNTPGNYLYFDSARRVYMQLKKYDELMALAHSRLRSNPNDANMRSILGSVLYKAGREAEAVAEWNRTIAIDSLNPGVYRLVANALLENRLLDLTADIYRRARNALRDQMLFTLDLAQLLAASMDFGGATREYLRWIRQNPTQAAFVQGRMASYTGKEEGRAAAVHVVQDLLRESEDAKVVELLAWLYLEGKEYHKAFETYKRLDRLLKARGNQLFAFGERAYNDRVFNIAAEAFREALASSLPAPRRPLAKYGLALALKEQTILADSSSDIGGAEGFPVSEVQAHYTTAVSLFREMIAEYPLTDYAARAQYQIGLMQFERFFDLDGALASFLAVDREMQGPTVLTTDVSLRIAQVLLAKGDTVGATQRLLPLVSSGTATPDQQDEATFRLAELDFFAHRFDQAVEKLSTISSNLRADFTNDALALLTFLDENRAGGENALKEFARAELLTRQRKYSEAVAVLQHVIQTYHRALLVDDALMRIALLHTRARRYEDAVASYHRLLTEFKDQSIVRDRAQFFLAEVHDKGLHQPLEAMKLYEQLLTDYPNSIFAAKARKRIRELRGDAL